MSDSTKHSRLSLVNLPSEVLTCMLKFLGPRDLFMLQLVSRHLNSLASTPGLWTALTGVGEFSASEDYIARYTMLNAPFRLRGLQSSSDDAFSIFGMDVLDADAGMVVGTADDGTVRVWNVNDSYNGTSFAQTRNDQLATAATSDIKVSWRQNRIWISADNVLQEWDLSTLRKVRQMNFDKTISAVCPDSDSALYVTTQNAVHYLDTRAATCSATAVVPGYPLTVLASSFSANTVSVCGRFPSILTYDNRSFPNVFNSTYSGAHALGSLLALPNNRGIVAAGEYNGRGTLEYYGNILSPSPAATWVNRYTAARSALLSLSQPDWTSECIIAGSADGAIRCFDSTQHGRCCRELIGTDEMGVAGESVMISKILAINSRTSAALVDGKFRILDVGIQAPIVHEDPYKHETADKAISRQMYEYVGRAARREFFGMSNLNAFIVSI